MSEEQRAIVPVADENWQSRVYALGGLIGAVLGLLSAYLFVRAAEEQHQGEAPNIPGTRDAVKLGISLLGIIRTITEWGSR